MRRTRGWNKENQNLSKLGGKIYSFHDFLRIVRYFHKNGSFEWSLDALLLCLSRRRVGSV